ncbi:hypothetical protein ECHHL_0324 [Ehrlichia chaffeensis str. Heartland]|uniref:hypothetical protein n=2 Tax=Ehrlichia chaffeensis TaxID=945 RepID=UPI000444EA0F|nr:hypothetical protein [Ehrlichia chaffeensis]AHX03489.1 hypothetical protein ECHHL_0324 [Ehrlichia chaffeensis str. Heartland]AHX09363.1 hypothetical protein ECHWAK_0731 [Ehrlichia chaffeensis str. Wakulla]AHX10738.1 hypothetical protein ECHWP_0320 [Ehrlichia chaffeensis str. West Paces]
MAMIIKFGVENLIDSAMEIVCKYFDIYQRNDAVKHVLHKCIKSLRTVEKKLKIYRGKEAKGHVISDSQFAEMEDLIKKVLMKVFEIDISYQKQHLSAEKMEEYKVAVSLLLDQIVRCKSYALKESDILPKVVGNATLKRSAYKCKHVVDFINKNRFLPMNMGRFDKLCFDLDLDPRILKQVIDLCSFALIFEILDLKLVQFLVEMRFFPHQNTNVISITKDNYIELMQHIMLYKCSQSIGKEYTNEQARYLPCFSPGYTRGNVKGNSFICLGIALFIAQALFNGFGLLFMLLSEFKTQNDLWFGICVVNMLLAVTALTLICIGKKQLSQNHDTLLTDIDVSGINIVEESVDL